MPSPVKPSHSSSPEGEKHKQLDREIRDMVSAITHRVTNFHKSGSNHHLENDEEHGVSMITLVGTNNGATMRSELDEKTSNHAQDDELEALSTYINSNFQAINNSIMFGGSYHANDPGVHMDISDFFTEHESQHEHEGEKGKKGRKKEKQASKTKHHSSHSD